MTSQERYKVLLNIVARTGIEGNLYEELARAEAMINAIDQGKMMPPPVPPEITNPETQEPIEPTTPQDNTSGGGIFDNV